jgi:hypothetical protein
MKLQNRSPLQRRGLIQIPLLKVHTNPQHRMCLMYRSMILLLHQTVGGIHLANLAKNAKNRRREIHDCEVIYLSSVLTHKQIFVSE